MLSCTSITNYYGLQSNLISGCYAENCLPNFLAVYEALQCISYREATGLEPAIITETSLTILQFPQGICHHLLGL
jgi:hypothetical protein